MDSLIGSVVATNPQTRRFLWNHVRVAYGIRLPRYGVCEGHCSPLDLLSHLWFTGGDAIGWANRGGMKTLTGAVLAHMAARFRDRLGIRILGGSLDQSKKLYDYTLQFHDRHEFRSLLANDPTISKTIWFNQSDLSILTQSPRSVRGPHVPILVLDEVDEFDRSVFQAALPIVSRVHGHAPMLVIFSTMHYAFGLMDEVIKLFEAQNKPIFKWCLLDCLEKCVGRSCSQCPLEIDCGGLAKRADGYITIDDAINLKGIMSEQSWKVEFLCQRPSSEGLVYPSFDPNIHIQPMIYDVNLPTFAGCDYGFTNPFDFLVMQVDADDNVRVVYEYRATQRSVEENVAALKPKVSQMHIRRCWYDPSSPETGKVLKQNGIPAMPAENALGDGIEEVRRKLKIRDTGASLFIDPSCEDLIRELRSYRYPQTRDGQPQKDNPAKINDHGPDTLRYMLMGLKRQSMGISEIRTTGVKRETSILDEIYT